MSGAASPVETALAILAFADIGAEDIAVVGGKGANLGALHRAGLAVPPGFCVTTRAFLAFVADDAAMAAWLAELDTLAPADLGAARRLGATMRQHLTAQPVPAPIHDALVAAWRAAGAEHAYAVRSSATAEDLPEASFAGQHDTYLNVRGETALVDRVRACWASLYTDRAILYRLENGIAARQVALSVVVQRMVRAEKSGVLFTADPTTGHRFITAIDAGYGLGEALVSGLISPDHHKVDSRDGRLVEERIGDKAIAIRPADSGGTVRETISDARRTARVLSDSEIAALVEMGRHIARLQGTPQDIEWCFEEGELYVVQARPITALYPLPEPAVDDGVVHVSFCVNHFQVMTDAMPPMALAMWRLMLPLGQALGCGRPLALGADRGWAGVRGREPHIALPADPPSAATASGRCRSPCGVGDSRSGGADRLRQGGRAGQALGGGAHHGAASGRVAGMAGAARSARQRGRGIAAPRPD